MNIKNIFQNFLPKKSRDSFFKNSNAVEFKWHISDCGRYQLLITTYKTGKSSWNYTKGSVYRISDDTLIAEVKRNYHRFPFLFVTDHPNGHHYMVCGEDYQGQTVIELDTGKRKDSLSDGSKNGWGFCWSSYKFHEPTKLLIVDGCYWGAPYEYKFFDFSNPMENGWPLVELGFSVDSNEKSPEFAEDGTIKLYHTRDPHEDDDDDYSGPDTEPEDRELCEIISLKFTDGKLVKTEEWVSDFWRSKREREEELDRKYNEKWNKFRETDPLYAVYRELKKDKIFNSSGYEHTAHTSWSQEKSWCPYWTGSEDIIGTTLHQPVKKRWPVIGIDWAVDSGPIRVKITQKKFWQEKTTSVDKWFEHSERGMKEAFMYAEAALEKKWF